MSDPATPSPTAADSLQPRSGTPGVSPGGLDIPARPPAIPGVPVGERRALVVGASSGMGAALVRRLIAEGYQVAAIARRQAELEALHLELQSVARGSGGKVIVRALDASDAAAAPGAFEEIVGALGGLDLFVFAAGVMPKIERTEYNTEKDLLVLDVNCTGLVAWGNLAAHLFTTQRRGTLVGISSIAGDRGRKGFPAYCASKAFTNTYLEALRNRLSEVGAHVLTIKPGYVDTAMTRGMDKLFWLISADEAARQILSAARKRTNTRYVPARWMFVGTMLKLIPSFVFRRLNF